MREREESEGEEKERGERKGERKGGTRGVRGREKHVTAFAHRQFF